MTNHAPPLGLHVCGPEVAGAERVLTTEALTFVLSLVRTFRSRLDALLTTRRELQLRLDSGARLGFLEETREVRAGTWKGPPPRADLTDRRVEITGPVDRKMIINALNSGANVFMADFEDATSPTFANLVDGQVNVMDAVAKTIEFADPATKRSYALNDRTATLMVRPRGFHLLERHVEVDGLPIPASLFDFGLHFFHNARALLRGGSGPYYYLPKLESHLEARLWNDVFVHAERAFHLPIGTIRATVLIETLPAAFEMDEILYELRDHSAGLNCGRWDYIFSFIKKRRNDPAAVLPDRGLVTMDQPFLRAYTQLLVKTCHRRGVHAMGGMAAQIPVKGDSHANEAALERVRADKLREVKDGHDGTWVAHPALVAVAREIFDAHMKGPNQLEVSRDDVHVTAEDLLRVPSGPRTLAGLRHNIRVGVRYLEAWLRGTGCVPLYNLMEDAATAEISRSQVWQWIHHESPLEDLTPLTAARFKATLLAELASLRLELGGEAFDRGRFTDAANLFEHLATSSTFEDFLTIPAYETIIKGGA